MQFVGYRKRSVFLKAVIPFFFTSSLCKSLSDGHLAMPQTLVTHLDELSSLEMRHWKTDGEWSHCNIKKPTMFTPWCAFSICFFLLSLRAFLLCRNCYGSFGVHSPKLAHQKPHSHDTNMANTLEQYPAMHTQGHRHTKTTALCTRPNLPTSFLNFNFIVSQCSGCYVHLCDIDVIKHLCCCFNVPLIHRPALKCMGGLVSIN